MGHWTQSTGIGADGSGDRWRHPDRLAGTGLNGDGVIDASTETGAIELRVPRHLEDLGIPEHLVHDLVLRQTMAAGRTSTLHLSKRLALSPMLMTKVVEELRDLRYLEVQGMEGRDYQLALTEAGRARASDRMQLSRYVGPAPVSLASYSAVIRRQHASP